MRKYTLHLMTGLTLLLFLMPARSATPADITDPSEMLSLYDLEAEAGRFDNALGYAIAGCERLKMLYLCREVADLPLQMARRGVLAPPRFADAHRRIATLVCLSTQPYSNSGGVNISGWLCNHYARQFAHAASAGSDGALPERARQYLESIKDRELAARLYQTACKNDSLDACNHLAATASGGPAPSSRHAPLRPAPEK